MTKTKLPVKIDGKIVLTVAGILMQLFGLTTKEITPTARLREDFNADSLDVVELALALEEAYKTTITDIDVDKFVTVQDILFFI